MIEYLAPNGAAWNPFTGCKHTQAECPTADKCWARDMSKRFKQVCGGDFEPRWQPDRLSQPFNWKKPRRVAVSFMGDLFGAWNDVDSWPDVRSIVDVVAECDRHQFLFLTKRPEALAPYNPWPANAWVGTSITGAETPERQAAMLEALRQVEGAGVRWISYEPALGPLDLGDLSWLDWLVVGAQSGRGAMPPQRLWLSGICGWLWRTEHNVPLWEKNNLAHYLKRPLTQELPK